ncbi:hypothetical protein SELMODRAFT_139940 [Selaginella moellendorffii]|uniref:CBS domain-containing protein n=1 Tax=Selaginella moellendorffii TaxID=88036 RepID=D8QN43_SELML|nr:SNF1-related protein kinase regulatory subunit gamma-1-like [Selaginella moellendorffii]XP_024527499.1 SNF1-related protein kinase regulatory subunit gamma-1-like [Selaginella moellendorffii]EFJ31456.1 hypothetical protein SELMODRAFT_144320 [Selaginella moellendorffii]EFJ38691.1 hypothetical protein SELMODRAFT_139940 [Selaginella moellendorffii]|eukprot:XP_002961152.1 SNF1-related protein kinase regulatory subunit gamma-1-like [Selaginella moellendorffii]
MASEDLHSELVRLWNEHERVLCQRGVPSGIQELLNSAFAKIPVSYFPDVPSGEVVEIAADTTIADTVRILSEKNIFSAPVKIPDADAKERWSERYLGMVDYSVIILWVLEKAELAATALASGSAAAAGMGAGAVGALGALALGATGPGVVVGLTAAAVGAAIAGGVAADKGPGKNASTAADSLGEDFFRVILNEEPFKSTKVWEITKSFRWAPFLPVQPDDTMLTVLLLLSKFRLRSIPIVDKDQPTVKNLITQSAVVKGLAMCRGRDWFDFIADKSIFQLGLPRMTPDQVVSIDADKLVLDAFVLMREKNVGGLPVVKGEQKELVGNISMRDIRFLLLQPELCSRRRELTVYDFMHSAKSSTHDPHPALMMPPITCEESTSLGEVIDVLSTKGIHRIHIVDDKQRIVGVVTLRDIISCFVTEPDNYFNNFGSVLASSIAEATT